MCIVCVSRTPPEARKTKNFVQEKKYYKIMIDMYILPEARKSKYFV